MDQFLFPRAEQVRVKICGITSVGQSEEIIELGVDALGFNFWPKSKRYLDPAKAEWLPDLAHRTLRIGVFVNPAPREVCDLLEKNLIDWAQLHGDETPGMVSQLQQDGWKVFKALGIKNRETLKRAPEFAGPLLLDAYAPVEYGGSGETMDWALGAEAVGMFQDRDVILAGGLTPENVQSAILQVHPAAVDVASGVESSPGIKDIGLCRDFIQKAQSVG
ncbi:MAG: phosphoribosylanthranilate isomerase [Verrucomicrobiales bacterium]|nr:phosphoribosylanthranilate isomerase [Verrucomicrobiales bacterium]